MIIHGRSRAKAKLQQLAASSRLNIEVALTENANHTKSLAQSSEGFDLVISCGGDGTNNHVVNGLMNITPELRPALGFIPSGSGNDFARVYPSGPLDQIIKRCENKTFNRLDLIELEHNARKNYVLNMTTCGIGAEIANTVNARKFKMPGALNYYTAIVAWLAKYKASKLEIHFNNETIQSETFMAAIGNGSYAGNGLGLNPQSPADDGLMGITLIGSVSVIDFLKYQSTLKRCDYIKDPRVFYHKSAEIKITVSKGTLPIETDGEFFARLNAGESLTAKILPSALLCV
jgi:diacylglycerol kinase (ATP)